MFYDVGSRKCSRFVNYKKGCTRLAAAHDKVYQLLAQGRWFSPGTSASSTTKTGRHDIAKILLKVALKHQKINQSINQIYTTYHQVCIKRCTMGATYGAGTDYPWENISGVGIVRFFILCGIFYRSLFVLLFFVFWPLYCLSVFDLLLLIFMLFLLNKDIM